MDISPTTAGHTAPRGRRADAPEGTGAECAWPYAPPAGCRVSEAKASIPGGVSRGGQKLRWRSTKLKSTCRCNCEADHQGASGEEPPLSWAPSGAPPRSPIQRPESAAAVRLAAWRRRSFRRWSCPSSSPRSSRLAGSDGKPANGSRFLEGPPCERLGPCPRPGELFGCGRRAAVPSGEAAPSKVAAMALARDGG